jgi:sterol desaturase/sphingolipid hydroxylase (fatty acid hydroxylase superfamily)
MRLITVHYSINILNTQVGFMESYLFQYEPWIRFGAFGTVFVAMAAWEAVAPRRPLAHPRRLRWPANLGVVALNTVLLRLVLPVTAIGFSVVAQERGWGLLNQLSIPPAWALVLAVIALDFIIYLQHIMFHAVPALWRLHRMHHADLDFDVTTGARFHPVEIMLSAGVKLAAVAVLGPSPLAVLLFEVLLNATSMFNHGNVRLPVAADRVLRLVVVTPDMHRVHHSALPHETNRNFGFNLPWWDRLFGTYLAQPSVNHERLIIGVSQFREAMELRLDRMLVQPFRGDDGGYPIGGREKVG